MGELLRFPERALEPLEPVSELIAASPELWARLIGSKATRDALDDNERIIKSTN